MELAKERAHLDAECTEGELEQEAAWCQEAMSSVLNATAKMMSICAKSKRRWISEIRGRRKAIGGEKQSRQNSDEAARAKAELLKSILRSKSQIWSDSWQILRVAKVWRAAQYANPGVGMTVENITDRDGKQANRATEKE